MIKTIDLSKNYGEFLALNKLNIQVNKGEIYCLLGANGAGKTTTIKILMNFIKPSSGEAYINNRNANIVSKDLKKEIAFIPENLFLYPNLTGFENLEYFSVLNGQKLKKEAIYDILNKVGLENQHFHSLAKNYSKGMRQKVGIAIALAKKSSVLLLDEPTSGLDPSAVVEFTGLLQGLKQDGVAILMTTHDLFRAQSVGTKIGIMKRGQLLREFDPSVMDTDDLERLYLSTIQL